MWRLLIILLFLVASVWIGLTFVQHPGYLFLVYQPWMIQMPLWFGAVTLFIFLIFFYLLISGVDRFQFLWFKIKNWFRFRREHQFYSKTQQGLSALIEGRFKKAERLLLAGVNQSLEPLINYLAAAKAAHEQKAFERRDGYIQKAYEIAPRAELAIGLTQAEFALEQNQLEQAEAILNRLRQLAPTHPGVLKLLEKVYVRLGDWQKLEILIPSMRKAKILTKEQAAIFEKNMYVEMLGALPTHDLNALHTQWSHIPRSMKYQSDVAYSYVKRLMETQGTSKEIEEVIRKTLKKYWQPELVRIYGRLPFINLNRQLVIVSAWMKIYGEQPALLFTLGTLCVRVQLWGKAKDYYERCLAKGPDAEAVLAYGKLLERLGEADEAREKYQAGLIQLVSQEASIN